MELFATFQDAHNIFMVMEYLDEISGRMCGCWLLGVFTLQQFWVMFMDVHGHHTANLTISGGMSFL